MQGSNFGAPPAGGSRCSSAGAVRRFATLAVRRRQATQLGDEPVAPRPRTALAPTTPPEVRRAADPRGAARRPTARRPGKLSRGAGARRLSLATPGAPPAVTTTAAGCLRATPRHRLSPTIDGPPRRESDQGASVGSKGRCRGRSRPAGTSTTRPPPCESTSRATARRSARRTGRLPTPTRRPRPPSMGPQTQRSSSSADADAERDAERRAANTSIVVRVGSPGDDEGVSQAQPRDRHATATTLLATSPRVAIAERHVARHAGRRHATRRVSVRVFSPGDDGPVSQLNAATATADTSPVVPRDAIAQQDAAQNTVVSIRVESPGSVAAPVQQNQSTTEGDARRGFGRRRPRSSMAGDSDTTPC